MLIPHWTQGHDAALDVTVMNPLHRGLVDGSAEDAGHALLVAKRRKEAGAQAACEKGGLVFVPLAVETMGRWDQQSHPWTSLDHPCNARPDRPGLPRKFLPVIIVSKSYLEFLPFHILAEFLTFLHYMDNPFDNHRTENHN